MAEERETKVEEKPSTYGSRSQNFVIGFVILLLIVLLINAFMRSTRSTDVSLSLKKKEKKVKVLDDADSIEFNKRFIAAKEKLERNKATNNSDFKDVISKIKKRADFNYPPKINKDDWQQKELDRVRDSRYADDNIDLGFGAKKKKIKQVNNKRASQVASPESPLIDDVIPIASSRGSYDKRLLEIKKEIGRANHLKDLWQSGNYEEAQAFSLGKKGKADKKFSYDNGRVVGYAASNPQKKEKLPGQHIIPVGSFIEVALNQKLISDYIGPVKMRVTKDFYDITGQYILVPKESVVSGYSLPVSKVNEAIQNRMGIAQKWLVFPDGNKIDFTKQAALDKAGIAAVKGDVNYHLFPQLAGVAAMTLINFSTSREGSGENQDSTFEGEFGQSSRKQSKNILKKYLDLVPTITLPIGTKVVVYIQDDIFVYPYSNIFSSFTK